MLLPESCAGKITMIAIDERVRGRPLLITVTDDLLRRFWIKVDKGTDCWNWQAATRSGYGALRIKGVVWEAHRLAWLFAHGRIPAGKYVCHTCDNPKCVRPAHLFLTTPRGNYIDMVQKGRRVLGRGEKMGNTVLSTSAVQEIWRLRESKGWGSRRIGRAIGASHDAVEGVLQKRSWKHVLPSGLGRSRTGTLLPGPAPQAGASANSATRPSHE